MGALPDYQLQPARTPDQAPPLQVVPHRPETPQSPVPPQEPQAPEVAGDDVASSETTTAEATDPSGTQEPADAPEEVSGGWDLDQIAAWRTWAVEHLRPPDVVHQAAPGLKQLWEQATRGEHLPANALLQVAERARLALSLPVIAAAVLLADPAPAGGDDEESGPPPALERAATARAKEAEKRVVDFYRTHPDMPVKAAADELHMDPKTVRKYRPGGAS